MVPAALRRELGITPGAELHASVRDGRLTLQTPRAAWLRLRELFAPAAAAGATSKDVLSDRRRDAREEVRAVDGPGGR